MTKIVDFSSLDWITNIAPLVAGAWGRKISTIWSLDGKMVGFQQGLDKN
jgi:hypothetical protein